ncbi:MAG: transcription-repair coupling factor, partial [Burkholderiaceae bacterium]|nr:transcription-repair coupling factor [Burkholderiaceae bacterium]
MQVDLPKSLPKPGHRFVLPPVHGSADAFVLAQAATELKAQKRMLAVVAANATDAQRLLNEIPWFGSQDKETALRCHLLPDWETLPYDAFSPHQDLVSERLATLYEVQNGQCDVLIVPAPTAVVRMAPPSFLAAYTFFFKQ